MTSLGQKNNIFIKKSVHLDLAWMIFFWQTNCLAKAGVVFFTVQVVGFQPHTDHFLLQVSTEYNGKCETLTTNTEANSTRQKIYS